MSFPASEFAPVFEAFGLTPTGTSIYAFNPVFRVNFAGQDAVLKQTRSATNAPRIVAWTHSLNAQGVRVVAPLTTPLEVAGRMWTLYPFIPGRPYNGSLTDLRSAGQLLGQLHAAPGNHLPRFEWPDNTPQSIQEDARGLQSLSEQLGAQVLERLLGWEHAFNDEVYAPLQAARIPWVDASMDFKANNLVYDLSGVPTLIDPDNGDHAPRILDLALAVLLFHLDLPAPGRLLTHQEWQALYSGYAEQVSLTSEEKRLWPLALRYILQEWGVWHLLSDTEGWNNPVQRAFLTNLAGVDLSHFRLG